MKLEQQVVSLELAKKLKELGVKQESYFVWVINNKDKAFVDIFISWTEEIRFNGYGNEDLAQVFYSAFTVAELGEMLPEECVFTNNKRDLKVVNYLGEVHYAKNEADARAKMLIYLLENNLVDLKD